MRNQSRILLSLAGGAAALFFVCVSHVQAQSPGGGSVQAPAQAAGGGTVQAPVQASGSHAANTTPVPPRGPHLSALPLATLDQFTNAEKQAPNSVLTGTLGVSSNGGSVSSNEEQPSAYGTSTAPYTTARVAVTVLGNSSTVANTPVTSYPYRPTGKLYFKKPNDTRTFICSAALIKKGVLVTAAHCVHNFGQGGAGWYSNFIWCPANTSAAGGVYGCYNAGPQKILGTYFNGSDVCTQAGVVCNSDIATLLVAPRNNVYAGNVVGWYAYGWNCYSCVKSSVLGNVTTVQVTQLGYPGAFDSGYQLQRTEAVGWYFTSGNLKNTQIGSAQTGGSSGGPWLANLGTIPVVDTTQASRGSATVQAIIGVTSYGSTTIGFNRQGASFFGQNSQHSATYPGYGAGNIGLLVRDTCTVSPSYC